MTMKKTVAYKVGTRIYEVGDVVYLARKKGKPTCRAIAIKENNGRWLFKSFRKQSYYSAIGGLIPFNNKPYIFAKEIEEEEHNHDTI